MDRETDTIFELFTNTKFKDLTPHYLKFGVRLCTLPDSRMTNRHIELDFGNSKSQNEKKKAYEMTLMNFWRPKAFGK